METTKVNTVFMQGNKTFEIFDILTDEYGMRDVVNSNIDFCEAIFSDGFILAMEYGMMPILNSEHLADERKGNDEYHHLIFNDECYVMYFKEI